MAVSLWMMVPRGLRVGVGGGVLLFLWDHFFSPGGLERVENSCAALSFHFAVICCPMALLGILAEHGLRLSSAVRRRCSARIGPWIQSFVAVLPVAGFALWVPSGWLSDHWRMLPARHRVIAIAAMAGLFLFSVLLARVVVWLVGRYGDRRRSLPPFHWPVAIASAGLAMLFCALDRKLFVGLYEDFHIGLAGFAALMAGAFVVCSDVALFRAPSSGVVRGLQSVGNSGAAVLFLLSAVGFVRFASAATTPNVRKDTSGILEKCVSLVQRATDFDRDGFSSLFGGGDCRGFDADASPGRFDFPANGIDEDCLFGDSIWPATLTRVEYTPPLCEGCNVILVTVEALRADHVGVYGNRMGVTPSIDGLAESSLVFRNAYSTSTKTFYSVPALMSGRYASNLTRSYDHERVKGTEPYAYYVTEETPLLAEVLQRDGFTTAGFGHSRVFYWQGMDRGMTKFAVSTSSADKAFQFLKTAKEPFFVWMHPGQPHEPYVRHKGFDFGNSEMQRYDSEVAYVDSRLGRILKLLEDRHIDDHTIVIVTADHGEEFGDHGGKFHGMQPYNELIRVPLVIRVPGVAHAEVEVHAELTDLVPTIMELLGRKRELWRVDGGSLFEAMERGEGGASDGAYAEYLLGLRIGYRALVRRDWKIIQNGSSGRIRLYDMVRDPHEKNDVSAAHPEVVRRLYHELEAWPLRNQYDLLRAGKGDWKLLAEGLPILQKEPLLGRALEIIADAHGELSDAQYKSVSERSDLTDATRRKLVSFRR